MALVSGGDGVAGKVEVVETSVVMEAVLLLGVVLSGFWPASRATPPVTKQDKTTAGEIFAMAGVTEWPVSPQVTRRLLKPEIIFFALTSPFSVLAMEMDCFFSSDSIHGWDGEGGGRILDSSLLTTYVHNQT